MYIGMLNHPDLKKTDMSCIKGPSPGAAPLPVEVITLKGHRCRYRRRLRHDGNDAGHPRESLAGGARKVGSIGVPISDTLCRIVDLDNGPRTCPSDSRES